MQKPDFQTLLALLAVLASFYMTRSKSHKESQQEAIYDVFGSGYDMRVILVGLPLLLAGLRWYYASHQRVSVRKTFAQEIRAANKHNTTKNSRTYVRNMVTESIQKAIVRHMVTESIQKAIANEAKMIAKHAVNTKNTVSPQVRDFVETMAEKIATRDILEEGTKHQTSNIAMQLKRLNKHLAEVSQVLTSLREKRRAHSTAFTQQMTIGKHGYQTPKEQHAAANWKALNGRIKAHEKEYAKLWKQRELLTGGFHTSINA